MNEPVVPGGQRETEWLAGEFAGKYFVQRITLDLAGRSETAVAKEWVRKLTAAIREVDRRHMITVGVIPWAYVFPGAKPLFYSSEAGDPLDFVSVHFYPKKGEVPRAIKALKVYAIGKPLVVEEIYPVHCSVEEADRFIGGCQQFTNGWISFYWGETSKELQQGNDMQRVIMAEWLRRFSGRAMQSGKTPAELKATTVFPTDDW
jgi:hypothetical protein